MRRIFLIAFTTLVLTAGSGDTASAACNARCQELCQQNPGSQTVPNCIKLWSCINAKYPGGRATQFMNNAPPPECQHLYKPKR
jgi:hypothetical protein